MRIESKQELSGRVITVTVEEKRDGFGTEMLNYNSVPGIIGASVQCVDGKYQYIYEAGDCISLKEYFSKEQISLGHLKRVIWQLAHILKETGVYFLSEQDILILADYMFWNEQESQLYVLYLDEYGGEVAKGIAGVLESFMDDMNHQDKELVLFVYGLHRITKDSGFSMNRLLAFAGEENGNKEALSPIQQKPDGNRTGQPKRNYKEQPEKSCKGRSKGNRIERLEMEKQKKRNVIKGRSLSEKGGKNIPGAVFGFGMGFVFVEAAIKMEIFITPVTGAINIGKVILFFLFLLAAECFTLRKVLFEKAEVRNRRIKWERGRNNEVAVILEPMCPGRERIRVEKSPFFIGRDSERTDASLEEEGMSQVHMKFVLEEGRAYVIDQESDRGTWKNGKQLIPWERTPLEEGDLLQFPTEKYQVVLSE